MEKLDVTELMNEISEEDFNEYREEVKQVLKSTIGNISNLKSQIEFAQSELKINEDYIEKVKELAADLKDIPYTRDNGRVLVDGLKQ